MENGVLNQQRWEEIKGLELNTEIFIWGRNSLGGAV